MMDLQRTNSSPGCSDVSKCCWSQDEIQALVTLWANQSVQEQLLLNLRNEKVFAGLSARLASLGFNKAPNRCREKIKKLKVEYKKIKDRNYRSGTNSDYGGVWFAIMDGVLNYQPGATTHSEPMELSSAEPFLPPEAQPFFTVEAGVKTQTVWSADEVQALLKLWGDRSVQRQLRSTVRNNNIFIRLSSELASMGFYKPPNRCREKIKKLKQEYKKIKSSGGPSGRERRWFAMMESVLEPQFAGEVPEDSSSASNLMDSAQLSSPSCLEFDKSDKSLPWSPNEVQDILGYQPGTLGLEPINSTAESSMSDSLEVQNFNAGAGRERIIWSRQEVDDLVMLWADNSVQKQLLSTYRNEKIFTSLSSQLMMMGYSKTASQCRAKIKKLKHEYRRIKDTGALSHQNSKWFIIMDDILSHQQEALPCEEADSAQMPLESTQPIWSIKVENSEVSQSGLFPEGPSISLDSSGCDLKTSPAALGLALEDAPLEDKNHCAWLPDEVQVFLTLWAQPSIQEQLLSTVRNNKVFTYLSNQLASVGFYKTPHQCRIKVKKLKQCYKKIKCMKDSKHVDSRWFAIMDSVLDPGGENDENETNKLKEMDTSAVLTHPGSPEDEPMNDNLRTIWTPDEVQVLLAWWADRSIQEQLTSTVRNERVFAQLSSELATLGFDKTPTQCRFKIKKLKQEYKKVKYQKDSKHRTSTWFAIMDNVLGHQAQEPDTEEAAEVTNSAPKSVETSQHGFPEQVEDKGGHLSFATLSLLVPTLRLMCAFAWQVVQHCNVMHYGKVEELVRLVTELVPQLLAPEEKAQLLLRLRARLVLELCRSESTDILQVIQPHLEVIHNLTKGCSYDQEENEKLENSESDLVEIVHTLLNDPEERKTFFKEVFPIHYGQQYEATLHSLVWKFISRLDKLLPIPDVKQTAEWLSTAPFAMEECGQLVLEPHQLKTLLHHHHRQKNMNKVKPRKGTSDQVKARRSKCMRFRSNPVSDRDNTDEGQSSHSREEEEAAEQKQSDDEWTLEDCSKTTEVLDFKDQQEEALAPVKHSDVGDLAPLRLHTCSLCPYAHGQVAGLLQHIRKEHLVKEPGHLSPEAPETNSVPQQAEIEICIPEMRRRIHTCNQCGKVFKKLSTLTRHMGTHTLPFHCDQCNKRCSCKELLVKHQRVHTGERPYKCSHCGRGFMHSATLKMHVRIHTGDRPYVCHICGKTSIQHLARHMLMHKGEKNYLCTECGKAFLSSGELRLHMRYHTGERPYTCKQCGRGFIAKCHLTIHMRSHTGERPYTCSLCPKSFPTSNLLKRHTFIHYDKKPFQCFKCGKGFAQAHTMKIHIRTRKCK